MLRLLMPTRPARTVLVRFAVLFALLATACVREVDLEHVNGPPSGRLVVEGYLTNEAKAHRVRLTRTGPAIVTGPPAPVPGAAVSISDGERLFALAEHPAGSGQYFTADTVRGAVGKTYTLTITLDGRTHTAADRMEPVAPFSERDQILLPDLYLFGNPERGFTLEVPTARFGFPAAVQQTVGFVNPQRARDRGVNEQTVFYHFPGVEPNGLLPRTADPLRFQRDDTLFQSRASMSEAYQAFSRAMLIQAEYFGGVLGSVPADLPTNVSGGAVGFFAASAVVSRRFRLGE
ncbi:MAG: DUF4249 domain-containing protein [Cytophagales bacterium]|nr:DUF4249 domain-containing protein [Cytophagales bacterium]